MQAPGPRLKHQKTGVKQSPRPITNLGLSWLSITLHGAVFILVIMLSCDTFGVDRAPKGHSASRSVS